MKLIIILLIIIIIGLCMIYNRQNNTCVEKFSLGDLNDWARDTAPKTTLNNWCVNRDRNGQDLGEGQYCVANCAGIGNNNTDWYPGGKIKKVGKGLKWEKHPGHWKEFNPSLSKMRYCSHVGN
jgi:hypothetical protein